MARYGTNGFPLRTICFVKDKVGILVELRGKLVEIVREKHWNDTFKQEGYFADEVVNKATTPRWFVTDDMLEFRSFPVTLQNWCRTKVSLLTEIDPRIAYQLGQEKYKGTGEGSYERDYSHVPLGDNDAKK